MKAGNELVMSYDLSSLRHLASIGEPLNPEAVISLIETVPGEILVAFGEGYLRTDIKNNVRMTHVRYREAAH